MYRYIKSSEHGLTVSDRTIAKALKIAIDRYIPEIPGFLSINSDNAIDESRGYYYIEAEFDPNEWDGHADKYGQLFASEEGFFSDIAYIVEESHLGMGSISEEEAIDTIVTYLVSEIEHQIGDEFDM